MFRFPFYGYPYNYPYYRYYNRYPTNNVQDLKYKKNIEDNNKENAENINNTKNINNTNSMNNTNNINNANSINNTSNIKNIENSINKENSSITNLKLISNTTNSRFDSNSEQAIFEIFGINLYVDDLIILGILFVLYQQDVKDEMLYIILFLLLLS